MEGMATELALPVHLTVDRAEEAKGLMLQWLLTAEKQIKCSGKDVAVMDAAGLQLLLALYKTAVRDGKAFVIVNPSAALQEALNYSGADKILVTEEAG